MPVSIPIGAHADDASFKSVADQVEKIFADLGDRVGKEFGDDLAKGLDTAEATTRRSANKLVNSYDKVADAIGKTRVAQERLNQLQTSGARNDQIVRQVERVEAARRAESRAIRQTISDMESYANQARRSGEEASKSFSDGFTAGLGRSTMGRFFADLRNEADQSGSMTGLIAGRAIGAGITAGIAATTAGVAAIVGGIGVTLHKGFQRLQGIDQARHSLLALGHSGQQVSSIMVDAEASVKGTAFGLADAVGAAASAVAAGVEPGQQLTRYLTTIGDAAAVAGTGFNEMASIFNKVTTSNRAFRQELQQLADRGIPIFTWLQTQLGVTGEELDKMVKKGAIDAETFRAVVAENIGGAAQQMGQSFSGAVDNLGAAAARLGAAAIEPVFGSIADAVTGLTGVLDEMTAWMKAHQGEIISFFSAIGQAVTGTAQSFAGAASIIAQSISLIFGGLSRLARLGEAMPFGDQLILGRLGIDSRSLRTWADDAHGFASGALDIGIAANEARQSIAEWGQRGATQAPLANALAGTNPRAGVDGSIMADLPFGPSDARNRLSALGFDVQEWTDGAVKLVPRTEEAQRTADAWQSFHSQSAAGGGRPGPVAGGVGVDGLPDPDAGGGSGRGGRGSAPPPHFDPSLWSLEARPVPGTSSGPTSDTSIINARMRVEEARLRLLELEHKENVSQSALLSAKNAVFKAEQALRDAELKAANSHKSAIERHTSALQDIGARIDQDFGISRGLPGIAENLTKFLANLAFAPAFGTLSAIAAVNGVGTTGGGGLVTGIGAGAVGRSTGAPLPTGIANAIGLAMRADGATYQYGGAGQRTFEQFGDAVTQFGYDCCLVGETMVAGPQGSKPIRELTAGDEVYSYSGGRVNRQKVFRAWKSKTQHVFRIRTRNRAVVASDNHPFMVLTQLTPGRPWHPAEWGPTWKRADELKRGDLLVQAKALPTDHTADVMGDGTPVTEDIAWLIGAIVGDGTVTDRHLRLCLFGESRDRAAAIIKTAWGARSTHNAGAGLLVYGVRIARMLRRMGLWRRGSDKRIPEAVWGWNTSAQRAFLDGYCDADGHRPSDTARHGERTYHSSSLRLIQEVRELHMRFADPVSNISTNRRKRPKPLHSFTVWAGGRDGVAALRIRPGIARFLDNSDFTVAAVLGITDAGVQDTYDIEVEGDHCFIADGVVVHNSGFISDLYNALTGQQQGVRRFSTTSDFAALGFQPGYDPGSALNIGVTPQPGRAGHMAGNLLGIPVEAGGASNTVKFGGGAAGALDPQFSQRWHLPDSMIAGATGATGIGPTMLAPGVPSLPSPTGPLPGPGLTPGGGGGMRVPGTMGGPPQSQVPLGGLAPSVGAGGEGFQGVGGLPLDAAMMAASGLDLIAPGAGIAAQKGIQLANRAIGFAGQLAGIGVGGILETILPRGSALADPNTTWFGRIASGFAGARPAMENTAGEQAPPNPDADTASEDGDGGAGGPNITLNYTNNEATEDRAGADITRHLQSSYAGSRR